MTPSRPQEALLLAPVVKAAGEVELPGSKSISNRVLLLAALAHGRTQLVSLLDADDVSRMREALDALGVQLAAGPGLRDLGVQGTGGTFPNRSADLSLGNAGTAVRPLTAALAILGGDYRISGVARMHERPIGDLVDALRALHCSIEYLGQEGYPPLRIGASNACAGRPVTVRGDVSSQFLSGLLMALPIAPEADRRSTTVRVSTPLISRPYVEITTRLMRRFGVEVATPDASTFVVPAGPGYRSPGTLRVEGDASGASYFLAAGVLGGGPVRVLGVDRDSIQGDVAFAEVLAGQGAGIRYGPGWIEARGDGHIEGGTVDCTDIPDAAMTLAIMGLFARTPLTLTGIASWRVKETDRIAAMAAELGKLGAAVEAGEGHLRVVAPAQVRAATLDTYDDHRMAMCGSLAAFGGAEVVIRDPGCVAKTFPDYFAAFAEVTGAVPRHVHA